MHKYETLFVLLPGLPAAQVRETMERSRRLIEGMGGQVDNIDDWGTRDLAYLIRKQTQGNYVLVNYSARPDVVVEFERTLKLADEVLRLISVRLPEGRIAKGSAQKAEAPAATAATEAESAISEEAH